MAAFTDVTETSVDPECGHEWTVRTIAIQGHSYSYVKGCECPPLELAEQEKEES